MEHHLQIENLLKLMQEITKGNGQEATHLQMGSDADVCN